LGVRGEAEVVVGGEIVQRLAAEADERTGGQVRNAETATEVPGFETGEGRLQVILEHRVAGILHGQERTVHRGESRWVVGLGRKGSTTMIAPLAVLRNNFARIPLRRKRGE
jgi:hypothetical protein